MKRLIVFIFLCLLLIGSSLSVTQKLSIKDIFPDSQVEVYIPTSQNISDFDCVQNGEGQIIFCTSKDVENIVSMYGCNGFTVKVSNKSISEILSILSPKYSFELGSNVYGYVHGFNKNVQVAGEKVNFQCAGLGQDVLVGFPILLGSY